MTPPPSPDPSLSLPRRHWLGRAAAQAGAGLLLGGGLLPVRLTAAIAGTGTVASGQDGGKESIEAALRRGGCVLVMRHALAPGTFDPPGFRLGDCRTQRNLDDEGRAQARRIGAWFEARGLKPSRVRSSPWCRCLDTARLAFGQAQSWAALGSPRGADESTNAQSLRALDAALQQLGRQSAGFEVWVTHMFVLSAWLGESASSGEGLLLLPAGADGKPRLAGRLSAS